MRSNLIRTALAVAALALPAAALAWEPASRDQRSVRSDPRAQREAPPELICRSVETAGSGEAAALVCLPAADWRRETE